MRIAIYGYGNLGKGVECAAKQNPDVELVGVFTRRDPSKIKTLTGIPVYNASDVKNFRNDIDVLIICGGSATDLPEMTPALAKDFCVVDSFDNHSKIPEHFENVDRAAKQGGNTALISGGWDPGMFSLARLYSSVILPNGNTYTFWGKGVSQGHSDAIRRIEGVADARQYTIPVEEALKKVRNGEAPELTARQKHTRLCCVVAKEGADKARIENEIKTMPGYFADYDVTVDFITQEELDRDHAGLPHGGFVIRTGRTGLENNNVHAIEYSLRLDSNPEFTSSVLVACARAVFRMKKRNDIGCKTLFDVMPKDLSALSEEELRKTTL